MMNQQERLKKISTYLREAANLADEEVQEQKRFSSMATAFRAAANVPESAPPEWGEISGAFNVLTANLLYAGMPLRSENEIHIRINNAISEAVAKVVQ